MKLTASRSFPRDGVKPVKKTLLPHPSNDQRVMMTMSEDLCVAKERTGPEGTGDLQTLVRLLVASASKTIPGYML